MGLIAETPYVISQCCVFPRPPEQFSGWSIGRLIQPGCMLDFLEMPFLDPVNEGAGSKASYVVVFLLN